jgi:hypothetical protein
MASATYWTAWSEVGCMGMSKTRGGPTSAMNLLFRESVQHPVPV